MPSSLVNSNHNNPALKILESRQVYTPCHIYMPETGERSPAIAYQGEYYSFFRVEATRQRAIEVATKLQRNYHPIITQIPKGYAIWTLEAQAQAAQMASGTIATELAQFGEPAYHLLISPGQYTPCLIRVPDLDQSLQAIAYNNLFYSLFKSVSTIEEAIDITKRLPPGDRAVITKQTGRYSLWIHEPEAYRA
ncbi:hypothetical protein ACQ4M4_02085 [Leptolyngbya sp. AN02str]|uniref:hypothetical protein n=1 Tax=Leptolyngbya sp. AN02str TaxID=3423363 RepID=UPI003D319C63